MTDPRQVADAIFSATATATPPPGGGLLRRVAEVTTVNTAGTVTVIWPTGDTITSVPICCDPWPQVGDIVLLLGVGGTDWAVWGIVQGTTGTRPQAGRGIVARVASTTDSLFFAGPANFEVIEMRTSTAPFYTGRLYRSTVYLNLAANGGSDSAVITVKRSGGVVKATYAIQGIVQDGFATATPIQLTCDYNMPTGSFYIEVDVDPTSRSMKFYTLGNAFHTVEDIGPDAW